MNGPPANSANENEIEHFQKTVARLQLCGLANDTRWNQLLKDMRAREGWTPRFRYKCIDSDLVSRWDLEWRCHVPMPFISVSWLEIEHTEMTAHLPARHIDHRPELSALLTAIGLDCSIGPTSIRIFGYSPRDHGDY